MAVRHCVTLATVLRSWLDFSSQVSKQVMISVDSARLAETPQRRRPTLLHGWLNNTFKLALYFRSSVFLMKSAPSLIFLEYKCYLYLVFEVAKKESVGQHVCPVVVLLTILIRYFCTKCRFLHFAFAFCICMYKHAPCCETSVVLLNVSGGLKVEGLPSHWSRGPPVLFSFSTLKLYSLGIVRLTIARIRLFWQIKHTNVHWMRCYCSPDEDDLSDKVDLIFCLGGDRSLLYASSLFSVRTILCCMYTLTPVSIAAIR